MALKRTLNGLVRAVLEEAERNPEFLRRLEEALGTASEKQQARDYVSHGPAGSRAAHRRAPAVLDPVELAREGELVLRERLKPLSLEQLKDIVADYGMDTGKLVLKWKTHQRIIDRIVDVSLGRARKGQGFLLSGSGSSSTSH